MRLLILPALLFLLSGCIFSSYKYPRPRVPTSQQPGSRSLNTDLALQPGNGPALFEWPAYTGYSDARVLALRTLADTAHRPFYHQDTAAVYAADKVYFRSIVQGFFVTPGTVWIEGIGLSMDEVEVPNIEWQHFLNYVAQDSGQAVATRYFPQNDKLPLPSYFTAPFYRYYPVTGISRAQAEAYCRWRSTVITQALSLLRQFGPTHPDYLVMRYRLPTEAEWEYAAGGLTGLPYGVNWSEGTFRVHPKAATYLRARSLAKQPEAQIRQDIQAFNQAQPTVTRFNCQRQAPYFLALPTPGYVFDLPQNDFGLYHMSGNVAELVQEPGLTKGGSYLDPLEACAIKAHGTYTGPAPTLGFRCVCEVTFPNRK